MTDETGEVIEAAAPEVETAETHSHEAQSPSHEQEGLLAALKAERSSRQQLQERLEVLEQQSQLKQPESPSYDDDDVVTYSELKKVEQQYKTSLEEMRVAQKYPDYQEVVSKYLPEILNEKPRFKQTLAETQDFEMAYFLAKNSDRYRKDHQKQEMSADAQRIMENTQKSGSLSSIGAPSPVQKVKQYKNMSDEEFRKEMAKHMAF